MSVGHYHYLRCDQCHGRTSGYELVMDAEEASSYWGWTTVFHQPTDRLTIDRKDYCSRCSGEREKEQP